MTVKEMKARLRAINTEAANTTDTEVLNKLLAEAEDLNAKIDEAKNRARLRQLAGGAAESPEGTEGANGGEGGSDTENAATKRGKTLLAGNKVSRVFAVKNTLSSSSAVLTQHTATDVKETFNEVSSLVDRVKVIPLPGGESYKRGFVKSYGEGGYTAEGADYTTAEPTFGYLDDEQQFGSDDKNFLNRQKITIEFYSRVKDRKTEQEIERALNFVEFDKWEEYKEAEKLYFVSYEFEIISKLEE